jgi:hypothetical protein
MILGTNQPSLFRPIVLLQPCKEVPEWIYPVLVIDSFALLIILFGMMKILRKRLT